MTRRAPAALEGLVRPVVTGLGYEYVGMEYLSQGRRKLLRVFVDAPAGVTLDDCERVSHQLSGMLDVEDPVHGAYTLEVSSPGLDRPLFTAEHYSRFAGRRLRVRLGQARHGQRNFSGVLRGIDGGDVLIDASGEEIRLPLSEIEQARLIPEFD